MNTRQWCKERFLRLWQNIGADYEKTGVRLFEQLAVRYEETHRHYHTLEHIRYCLEVFDKFRSLSRHPGSVEIAIFYHDVIYDVAANSHNEELSAVFSEDFFYNAFYGTRPEAYDLTKRLILATKHDHEVTDPDEQLIVDIDLAGLGAPWAVFLENNLNVRQEYKQYSDEDFRVGNAKVLQQFLDRRPLYYHPEIEAKYGDQARDNLTRWLNRP